MAAACHGQAYPEMDLDSWDAGSEEPAAGRYNSCTKGKAGRSLGWGRTEACCTSATRLLECDVLSIHLTLRIGNVSFCRPWRAAQVVHSLDHSKSSFCALNSLAQFARSTRPLKRRGDLLVDAEGSGDAVGNPHSACVDPEACSAVRASVTGLLLQLDG